MVRTRCGEGHAVLLVATDQGALVLDSLSPWIVGWQEAPYAWVGSPASPWSGSAPETSVGPCAFPPASSPPATTPPLAEQGRLRHRW